MARKLLAGAYEADLNPALRLPISGYMEPKRASRFIDRLYAKAVSLRSGDARVLIASLDLVGLAKHTCDEVRREVESRHGIPRENVVLLSTHTHSGPETFSSKSTLSTWPPRDDMQREIVESIERMKREIIFALEEAMKDERPIDRASVSSIGIEGMFTNRNVPTREIDRTLTSLRLGGDRPLFLVNHNCHPTVLGANNTAYSADFPAYVSRNLAKNLGAAQVNCITGSCGDVSTRLTLGDEFSPRRNPSNTVIYGDTFADLVIGSQRTAKAIGDLSLQSSSKELELKVKKHPNADESKKLQRDLESDIKRERDETKRSTLKLALTGVKIWQETLKAIGGKVPETTGFDLGVVSLGEEFALVWASGEVCSATGLKLKETSRFGTTMLSGYANGDVGYIPPPSAYKRLEYEALSSPLEEGGTRLIERELTRLLR